MTTTVKTKKTATRETTSVFPRVFSYTVTMRQRSLQEKNHFCIFYVFSIPQQTKQQSNRLKKTKFIFVSFAIKYAETSRKNLSDFLPAPKQYGDDTTKTVFVFVRNEAPNRTNNEKEARRAIEPRPCFVLNEDTTNGMTERRARESQKLIYIFT